MEQENKFVVTLAQIYPSEFLGYKGNTSTRSGPNVEVINKQCLLAISCL